MLVKLSLTLDYNPETQTIEIVEQQASEGTAPKKAATKKKSSKTVVKHDIEGYDKPTLKLDVNKYMLNKLALDLFNIDDEDEDNRFDIKYKNVNGVQYPVLGTPEAFGTASGNKLSKTGTVSYRGKAREMLAEYGEVFTLKPYTEGLFLLESDKMITDNTTNEEHIEIPDFSTDESDSIIDINFDFEL